jgi:hypothetical protein
MTGCSAASCSMESSAAVPTGRPFVRCSGRHEVDVLSPTPNRRCCTNRAEKTADSARAVTVPSTRQQPAQQYHREELRSAADHCTGRRGREDHRDRGRAALGETGRCAGEIQERSCRSSAKEHREPRVELDKFNFGSKLRPCSPRRPPDERRLTPATHPGAELPLSAKIGPLDAATKGHPRSRPVASQGGWYEETCARVAGHIIFSICMLRDVTTDCDLSDPRTEPMSWAEGPGRLAQPKTSVGRSCAMRTALTSTPDLRVTLVVAVEVSKTAWVIAAHVPGGKVSRLSRGSSLEERRFARPSSA